MAYKRYVHKKGKRHGPYYYKNIRDESGKVKSIYLGKVTARGKKPLEVAIVFLVILLIVISALFFIQNRNLVLSRISAEETKFPFEVDQILIKVLVKADEYIEKELRVMNVADEEIGIEVDVSLADIVDVLDKGFTIKPGQTKIVRLNLSSFNNVKGTEQSPGVYMGKILVKTDSYEKEVPVVVEIESKNVLFDMNLNPVARDRKVVQGDSTTFEIRVFNLQSIESFNVGMEFFVKDANGNTIISEKESVVVKTQASFFKTLKIPRNLKTGDYVFIAQASLGNSIGTASYLFEVESVVKEQKVAKFIGFCRDDPLCWALSIIVLLLIFTIGAYAYFFAGVFVYEKLFGVRISKAKKVEEAAAVLPAKEKKENPIISSFRHVGKRIRKAREKGAKKKLELEEQKLELKEREEELKQKRLMEREKELEIKKKLKEKKEREKEGRKGLVGNCRKLIDKGYRALDKNNLQKSDNIYAKLMDRYMGLPSERKVEIFKEINSFYKSLLLKKQQLRQAEGERKKKEKEDTKRKELEKKKEHERRLKEKERREKLGEERRKAGRKSVFKFFHGLGLVKTEEERREQKLEEERQRELGLRRREEEKGEKEEEERREKLERRRREEEERRIEEEKRKQKLEEERQKEIEKEKQEEEQRRQRELGLRRREEEKKRIELEEKRREEEKKKLIELDVRRKDEERRRKQKGKEIKLREIKELEESISEKDAEINKLRENIKETLSDRKVIANEISGIEKDISGLKNEKNMLFKVYNESAGTRKKLAEEHKNRLAEWRNEYDAKVKEKSQVKKEVEQEYEDKIKELESELEELSRKERTEQEKWKKLELKAKYKLEEKEREKTVREEIKDLRTEKREIEKEFNEKKQGLGKGVGGKDILQRQKELDDHIREHEKGIEELKKKISSKERSLDGYENRIERLEEEKANAKSALMDKRKELGGLNYLGLFFKFAKKVEPEKVKKEKVVVERERVEEVKSKGLEKKRQKELEERKREEERSKKAKLRQEKRKTRGKKVFDFFHGVGLVKTEKEKKEYRRQKQKEKEQRELEKRKLGEKERRRKEEVGEFKELGKQVRGLGASKEKKGAEEEHDLEKSLKELGEIFEERKKEKKHGIIKKLVKREKKVKQPEEAKAQLKKKLEGKSRTFIKCHKLLSIADKALQNNDIVRAKKLYLKTRDLYIKLEYLEKKEIYNELTALYNKLSKSK